MIAVYYLFDKKPTLITNGVAISYGGTFDYKEDATPVINTGIIHDDINFYDDVTMADGEPETMYGTEELALGESDNSGIIPKWCGDQHHNMTNQSLYILSEDNINNKTPKKSQNYQDVQAVTNIARPHWHICNRDQQLQILTNKIMEWLNITIITELMSTENLIIQKDTQRQESQQI